MQILFAKCIDNQRVLISICKPSGWLIWLEGKTLTNQHF